MEQHLKALLGVVATGFAWLISWAWAAATSIAVLSVIDLLLRICLTIAGLVVAYYTARYYKRNTRDDGQDSGV